MTAPAMTHAVRREAREAQRAEIGRYTASFGLSLGITSVLSALLVVIKESNEETVLAWMKAATGHHWVTHGILDVVIFLVLGFALAGIAAPLRARPMLVAALGIGGVVLGALIVVGFYL